MSAEANFTRPARLAAIAHYFWMALFFLVPFLFVLKEIRSAEDIEAVLKAAA